MPKYIYQGAVLCEDCALTIIAEARAEGRDMQSRDECPQQSPDGPNVCADCHARYLRGVWRPAHLVLSPDLR